MATFNEFYLTSYVRIDSTNKSIRVTKNNATSTITLTEGVYWGGFGEGNPLGALDSASFNQADGTAYGRSFFEAFTADIGFDTVLETTANPVAGPTTLATGHVWILGLHANDQIDWDHAGTTVKREWFGVNANSSTSSLNTSYVNISQFSSSLAFVGAEGIIDDRPSAKYSESNLEADSGRTQHQYYGKRIKRFLDFRVQGIPRQVGSGAAGVDTGYHTLRRFVQGVHENGAGRRVVYIPDIGSGQSTWKTYSADVDNDNTYILGVEDFVIDVSEALDWDEPQEFANYNKTWRKSFLVKDYVA